MLVQNGKPKRYAYDEVREWKIYRFTRFKNCLQTFKSKKPTSE
jgi:hypothetical protein